MPNARPSKPTHGRRAKPSTRQACNFRRSNTTARHSSQDKPTISTSSLLSVWRFSPRRRSASPTRCSSRPGKLWRTRCLPICSSRASCIRCSRIFSNPRFRPPRELQNSSSTPTWPRSLAQQTWLRSSVSMFTSRNMQTKQDYRPKLEYGWPRHWFSAPCVPLSKLETGPSSKRQINHLGRWEMFCLRSHQWRFLFSFALGICLFAFPVCSQTPPQEPLPGPDSHETGQGPHGHLFGTWGGERPRLEERGVSFDFQYVSDSLWNLKSVQPA